MKKIIITDYTDDFIKGLVKYSGEHNAKDLLLEKTEALLTKNMKGIVHDEHQVKYMAEIYNHVLSPLTETGEKSPLVKKNWKKLKLDILQRLKIWLFLKTKSIVFWTTILLIRICLQKLKML